MSHSFYFYHLLSGSESESGITTDRIVVFDDPVSSLDSDVLYIVSSLIRQIAKEIRDGTGHIKQLFVLTHNVYFHKEVTFARPKKRELADNRDTFWVVRKAGLDSIIERHASNPIQTSYQLLWSEVRRGNHSASTIQNTLRRIIEYYFTILGDDHRDEICEKFDGTDRLICNSLFSWLNDGSHNILDDLYVSLDTRMVEKYLNVFRDIFYRTGQEAHYKMMMGDDFVEDSPVVASSSFGYRASPSAQQERASS